MTILYRERRASKSAMLRTLALVQHGESLQGHRPDNRQAFRAEFIEGVLSGVVENIVIAVIEIDQVRGRNPAADKWRVVICNCDLPREKMRLIAKTGCRVAD